MIKTKTDPYQDIRDAVRALCAMAPPRKKSCTCPK